MQSLMQTELLAAALSAGDLMLVVVTISSVAAAVALGFGVQRLVAETRRLRSELAEVARRADAAVTELEELALLVRSELLQSARLLDRADGISATLQDASRLTYLAVSSPVIKAAAVASGVREGARRLRRPSSSPDSTTSR